MNFSRIFTTGIFDSELVSPAINFRFIKRAKYSNRRGIDFAVVVRKKQY